MRYIFFILFLVALFFTCNELNNPYDANSTAGNISQTSKKDTAQSAIITVVYDSAQSRTLIIAYFDSTHIDTLVDSLVPHFFVDTLHHIDSIHFSDTTIIQKTSYDTIIYQDTLKLTRYDTLHLSRYDTTWVTRYDTTHVNKSDTTHVFHYDTSRVTSFDTTHIIKYDTTHVTKFDTTHVIKYDTTHIIRYDTIQVATKPHLSFIGNINTNGSWHATMDTLSIKLCTLYTNDYRYGDCFPRGSNNPANCGTSPTEMYTIIFTIKFSCPGADSLRYYFGRSSDSPSDSGYYEVDVLHSSQSREYNFEDGFHVGPGVYQYNFSARVIKPYVSQMADWRYLTIVVLLGPGPGGVPGTGN